MLRRGAARAAGVGRRGAAPAAGSAAGFGCGRRGERRRQGVYIEEGGFGGLGKGAPGFPCSPWTPGGGGRRRGEGDGGRAGGLARLGSAQSGAANFF